MKNKAFNYILYGWVFILLVYRLLICFSFKSELANGESNNVWKAISIASGKHFYNNPEEFPLEVFQYNPISELPLIAAAKFFNSKDVNYVYNVTVAGRCYQLLCTMLLSSLIYSICRKIFHREFRPSLIATLISITMLTPLAFTIRPDSTMLLFLFSSIYAFSLFLKHNIRKWMFLSIIFIVLSFLAKQDGVFIVAPFSILLLFTKRYNDLFIFVLQFLTILALTVLGLYVVFGDFYFVNTFLGIKNTMSFPQFVAVFDRANSFFGFFIISGIIMSIFNLFRGTLLLKLFSVLYLFYFFLSIATSFKLGSWVNYYTPNVILSILLMFATLFNYNELNSVLLHKLIWLKLTLLSFVYIVLQCYNYTYPFLKQTKHQYYKTFGEYRALNSCFPIQKNNFVFVPTPILKNFYAVNNSFLNIEYYNYASFKYQNIKSGKTENLKLIICKKNEFWIVQNISNFFALNLNHYSKYNFRDYIVFYRK
jgi:hypothetical protein